MTREEFYQNVEGFIMGMLPEKYAGLTPILQETVNQGGRYMGLILQSEEPNGIAPVFNLDSYYEQFGNLDEIDMLMEVSNSIVRQYEESTQEMEQIKEETHKIRNFEYAKTKLFIAPLSLARQEEEDLTVVKQEADILLSVRILIGQTWEKNSARTASGIVKEGLMEHWGKSFDEVYQAALENTPHIAETQIIPMGEIVREMMGEDMENLGSDLWIVKNNMDNHGAANFFLPGVMEQVAEKVKGSYFIIPSSVHEVIIHPLTLLDGKASMNDIDMMESMIRDVNTTLAPDELLSNNLYFYNAQTKQFDIAKDALRKTKEKELTNEGYEVVHGNPDIKTENVFQPKNF